MGPRTVATCAHVSALVGAPPASELKLSLFGGPLPDGREIVSSTVPRLTRGSHYTMFLDGTNWFWTPVISGMALRVERIGGVEVLLNDAGQVLTGVSPDGLHFAARSVFEDGPASRLGPGVDRFAPRAIPSNASIPPGALDRQALVAAVSAALANARAELKRPFSPVPDSSRKWNRTPVAAAQ